MNDHDRGLSPLVVSILTLAERGVPKRQIARQLNVSRGKVIRVLKSHGRRKQRSSRLDGLDDALAEIYRRAEGNAVLAHKWLVKEHALEVSYPTVHRRLEHLHLLADETSISHRFETEPGEEAQSDSSLYTIELGGICVDVTLYRVVLAYSRYDWGRFYLRFRRPDMKRGTYAAIESFGGSTKFMVIDNTSLAVDEGTGRDAVISPDMAEFARALGFVWLAHEKGHADRSGKVERFFYYVETNFLPGRTFRDLDDLNAQYEVWIAAANARVHGTTRERPMDRLVAERAHLLSLPRHPIDLSEVVARKVTVEGFVNFETNRYSVPARHLGKTASVHADDLRVRVFIGPELVATHERVRDNHRRVTDPTHHPRPVPEPDRSRAAVIADLHRELPAAAELFTRILEDHPNDFNYARRVLDELRKRTDPRLLTRAIKRALRFRAHDIKTVVRILEAEWLGLEGDEE